MGEKYWENFTCTGKVEDYLYYKGMEICERVLEKYDRETENGQAGGKSIESVYNSDRNGSVSNTYWGI